MLTDRIIFKSNRVGGLKSNLEAALIYANEMAYKLGERDRVVEQYNEFKKEIIMKRTNE